MPTTDSLLPLEELAARGGEVYERLVRPVLGPDDDGKFIAIDVRTGDHEMDPDDYTAVARLRARHPGADIWLVRAGSPTTYRMGVAQ
ncbi:Uncharacterized protein OS=Oscillatoria acuminata PCC 6304 GN=Oscil6304_2893 PE=4 SV=1 [Gemmataceae bacterium]|nr:Uncharacterized protein OS=Oscillatoria acuminata PCC 6304 GN=Oscil6304_2893 PE=4 SV=1 [Gemmataceae bacterium]VTU00375.1 Uncharacterized protein OS=Oscillatoria acuminata PCC 6304 GN=Oscil6304_2893 PE=4 SV=1 [Gemmataceae bacterium]